MKTEEAPVNSQTARLLLGREVQCPGCKRLATSLGCRTCHGTGTVIKPLGASYMVALRKAMGITTRLFFVSDVKKYIRENPKFNSKQHTSKDQLLRDCLAYLEAPHAAKKPVLIARLQTVVSA